MVLHRTGEMSGGDHIVEFRQPPCTRCGSKELHWEIEDCPQCHARTKDITVPGCRAARECRRCGTRVISPEEQKEPGVVYAHPTRSDASCSRCGEPLSRTTSRADRFKCRVCGPIYRPLTHLHYIGEIHSAGTAVARIAAEIGRHPRGISFEDLRSVLARDYLESCLRPRYIREHVERCIKEGLIVATVGSDGTPWYVAAPPKPDADDDE